MTHADGILYDDRNQPIVQEGGLPTPSHSIHACVSPKIFEYFTFLIKSIHLVQDDKNSRWPPQIIKMIFSIKNFFIVTLGSHLLFAGEKKISEQTD
jgi:hypothetical protein